MKIAVDSKVAGRLTYVGASLVLAFVVFKAGLASAERFALGITFLYGGTRLAVVLSERLWASICRLAVKRNAQFPRLAATVVLAFALFLIVVAYEIACTMPGGHKTISDVSGLFLLTGACLAVGQWLSKMWEMCTDAFHRPSWIGGKF